MSENLDSRLICVTIKFHLMVSAFICTWCILTALNLVLTAPSELTSESPNLTPRTESPTNPPHVIHLAEVTLIHSEMLSMGLALYSDYHFTQLVILFCFSKPLAPRL